MRIVCVEVMLYVQYVLDVLIRDCEDVLKMLF